MTTQLYLIELTFVGFREFTSKNLSAENTRTAIVEDDRCPLVGSGCDSFVDILGVQSGQRVWDINFVPGTAIRTDNERTVLA